MNRKQTGKFQARIGATNELSLRVSVATLVRVLFENPKDDGLMLALERKATLLDTKGERFVEVKCQPFGGAIRLLDSDALQNAIGEFHYDSEQSRSVQDFRVFIRPSAWETVREFCLQHSSEADDPVLEQDPARELLEEFADTLKINLKLDQFVHRPTGTIIENNPSPTENVYARGSLTARIYHIFEAHILDRSLVHALIRNSEIYSDTQLRELALEDFRNAGPGWANAVFTCPLSQISAFYLGASPEARNQTISFQSHQLDETVAAILDGIPVPKYERA